MKNKLLLNTFSILFSACFSLAAFAVPAMQEVETAEEIAQEIVNEDTAELAEYKSGYYTYTVFGGEATIIDCDDSISGDVIIPSKYGKCTVTGITQKGFSDCVNITSITIPDTITYIGGNAFSNCKGISSITIPSKVQTIFDNVFIGCVNLKSIFVDSQNEYFSSDQDGVLYNKDKSVLCIFPAGKILESYTISDSVTKIRNAAFYSCTGLSKLIIPDSVTEIGSSAFSKSAISCINIPSSVKNINDRTFNGCENLVSVETKNGLETVGYSAFGGCANLSSIIIPRSVNSIHETAFGAGTNVKIYGFYDSYAIEYCNDNGIPFVPMYDVIYNVNGGTKVPDNQIKISNVDLYISNIIPARDGYDFVGWSVSQQGSVEYLPGDKYSENNSITLYAVWSGYDYTISFDANGGDGAPKNVIKTYGTNLYLPSTVPTREGYTFKGWSKSPTSTNSSYIAGGTYTDSGYVDITLYAVWQEKTYTVKYNTNGGSYAPSSQTKYYFNDLSLTTSVPTRTGYTFLGWSTTSTGTSAEYQPGDTYTNNEDITLYAVWDAHKYTITYDANGGTGAPESQIKTYGTNLTLSSVVPEREGYNFKGWSASSTATSSSYSAGGTYTDKSDVDVTLYAVWQEKTYSVTYYANGGSSAWYSQTKYYFSDLTLRTIIPMRTGCEFLGWSTSADGKVEYNPGDTYTNNEALTLYAVWYLPLSGTCGENATWSISENNVLTISGSGAMTNYSSYSAAPWYASRSNITEVVIGDEITSIGSYAFYDCSNLTGVTFGENSALSNIGSYAFTNCNKLKGVYISNLAGWCNIDFAAVESNPLYYAKNLYINGVLATDITIPTQVENIKSRTFYNCSSIKSVIIPESVTSIREYAFYNCTSLKTVYYQGTNTDFGNITIGSNNSNFNSANKVFNKFIISYDANGGENAPEAQIKSRGNALIITSDEPQLEEYDFIGWSTSADGEAEYVQGNVYSKNEDATLYAVWTRNVSGTCGFNLKWHLYDTKLTVVGTGSMATWSDSTSVPWDAYKSEIETIVISDGATSIGSYAFSDCDNLKTVTFTKTVEKINSRAFGNGSSLETVNFVGTQSDIESIEIGGYNDNFMNAVFNFDYVLTYTVTYKAQGASNNVAEQFKNHDEPLVLSSEIPVMNGYQFLGWSTVPNGEVVYKAGNEYAENADIILYAVWEINKYAVAYNANGGTFGKGEQTKTYDIDLILHTEKPTREGHEFLGWATSIDGGPEYQPGEVFSKNESVTLYAVWEIYKYSVEYIVDGATAPEAQIKVYGEPLTISKEVPAKEHYAFKGWATEQNGEVVYNPGNEYTQNADVVLYAVWEEVIGDASGDGKLSQEDINIAVSAIFGAELTEEQFKYANVYDADNVINIKDLIKLAQMMSGK